MSTALVDALRTTPAVTIPAWVRSLDGFRRWANSDDFPERGRISYLAGEIEVDMNAENISFHTNPKSSITLALGLLIEKEELGEFFPDGTLLTNDDADLACEPDFIYCSWDTLQSGRAVYSDDQSKDLRGAPDLVVEIVSPSSVRKDMRVLRRQYFLAGIPEYWLIDCRSERIEFALLVPGEAGYVESPPDADGFAPSLVFNRRFRLTRERNRAGHWRYALEQKPLS